MAVYKCKMCGGSLDIVDNSSITTCDYCGTKQTLPTSRNDVVTNLYNRANNLRLKCEFDKAEQVYEKILEIDNSEAEAHWGIILCKYGIEYVEDPKTYTRIPTCHRTLYEAVMADASYAAAIEHADEEQRALYMAEARAIDLLQKNILNIVNNESPFDVFICYKETDAQGKRTVDSVIANEIYFELTDEGYKVFYAPITLEDKLGQEYEPYIFAALNSSKVMLVVGTRPEHFDAIWVKNEWSRFLKLTKSNRSKLLIPCYRDMDAYDLPDEFAHLQAQDMSKIGFINDVVRGIKKIIAPEAIENVTNIQQSAVAINPTVSTTAPLLKRIALFLEDEDFGKADDFCEQVLNIDPENADAYTYKLLVEYRCNSLDKLSNLVIDIKQSKNYSKIIRFGSPAHVQVIENVYAKISENLQRYYTEQHRLSQEQEKIAAQQRMMAAERERIAAENQLRFLEQNVAEIELDDEYFDFICPKCGETLSYTKWQIEESSALTCPMCYHKFKVRCD